MEDKKQIENLLVAGFRAFYPEFPKGNLVPSESPDFIMRTTNNRYLGIELTRLHSGITGITSDAEKSRIKREEEIVEKAADIFSSSSDIPLFVKFLFSKHPEVSPERILSVSAQAVQVIRKETGKQTRDDFISLLIADKNLPAGIKSILVLRQPGLIESVWERANNLGISDDIITDIRFSIKKKDEKLRIYHKRKLNLYWLLVIADRLQGISSFSIENKIQNHEFNSRFQHVFLYELMRERVFRLV